MRSARRALLFLVTLLVLPVLSFAQGERGAITGLVMDPTGAVVPEATVKAIETRTAVSTTVKSSSAGYYRVSVPPGVYRLEAKKEGFKTSVAENIDVPTAQVVTIDFTLTVGSLTESVTVTSEAPLLTPSSAEVGTSVTPTEFATLPIQVDDGGRQLQTFIFTSLPGTVGDPFSGSINGGQLFSSEILIDGISIARYDLSGGSLVEFSPSTDAIGEFKVQQTNYSAEYGESGGGIANFSMKSGTNVFHGTAYDYLKNDVLNAAGFSNNANAPFGVDAQGNAKKRTIKENNFGFTLGGPIRKERTFFFLAYEGDRYRAFNTSGLVTLPTDAMKQGDFSSYLSDQLSTCGATEDQPCFDALDRPVLAGAIYDPTSTRRVTDGVPDPITGLTATANATIRDPFPGNIIPASMFSSASSVLLGFFPDPLLNKNTRNQPKYSGCCPTLDSDKYSLKIDHVINGKQKLNASVNYNNRDRFNRNANSFPPFPGFPLNPVKRQVVGGPQIRLAHNWTINDHTLNDFSMGYNRFNNANNIVPNSKYTPQLGIPGISPDCFPTFGFRGGGWTSSVPSRFGVGCKNVDPSESYIWTDTLSYLRGKHSFKFGGEFRRWRYNTFERGPLSGSFEFRSRETELIGFSGNTGQAFASFVLGAVDAGSKSVFTTEPGYRSGVLVFFAQDDWKATPKLTLNLGMRWEIPMPKKEAYNRQSGLDPTAPNPGADGFPGALVFLGNCSACINRSSFQDSYYKQFAPRLGIAYQARKNLVLRGGYGISFSPPILNNFGSQNTFGFNGSVNMARGTSPTGFSRDPVIYWSPLASGPPQLASGASPQIGVPAFSGTLPNRDPASANGSGIDFLPRKSLAQPYTQNWSAGLQYQLPGEVVLEANYVGSKGTRLLQSMFSNTFNQVPTEYMGLGDVLGEDLADHPEIPSPYPSFIDTNFNPTVAQALRPFPQYDVVTNNYPAQGSSTYHSLQLTVRKRAAAGLNFIGAYTFSKTLTDSDTALYYPTGGFGVFNFGQDFYNRRAEKSLAAFDLPHVLKLTWIYDLPFGRGKRWVGPTGGGLDRLVGGWTITAIQQYRSGSTLAMVTDQCTGLYSGAYGDGCSVRPDVLAPSVLQRLPVGGLDAANGTPYLWPGAFADPPLSPDNGFAMTFGTAPRFLPKTRGPGSLNEDFGILKRTRISERFGLDFRADMFNVFNRVGRGNPDTDVDSDTFGLVFDPAHGGRLIQLSLRLNF